MSSRRSPQRKLTKFKREEDQKQMKARNHGVNEMKDEQLQNFQHKIAGLCIFGMGELVDLIF